MSDKKVSWEIVVCGGIMTGMALMLWMQGPQPKRTDLSDHTSARVFHLNLPEGPSCDVLRVPEIPKTPAIPKLPEAAIYKDLSIKLKKLNSLKHLDVLHMDKQKKKVIIIRPDAEPEITISG